MGIEDTIKDMSEARVSAELSMIDPSQLSPSDLKRWREQTDYVCYDRYVCERLGIDYNRLPERDVKKAKLFAYYTSIVGRN